MDLQAIQGKMKQISYSEDLPQETRERRIAPSLTDRIIKSDRRTIILLLLVILQVVGVVLYYLILSIRCYRMDGDLNELYFYGFASAGFLSALPILMHKYNEFRHVDYSENTMVFLAKAAKRLRFRFREYIYIVPFLLLFDAGLCSAAILKMEFWGFSPLIRILCVQVLFLPYIGFAMLMGYFFWKRKKLPILKEIRKIQRQFTGSDPLDF